MATPLSKRPNCNPQSSTMATHFARKLGVMLCCLISFASIFSSVEGNYSNTVLYPVSEDTRAARQKSNPASTNNHHSSNEKKKRQPGAPTRYLEYEGPDATYTIRMGTHPTISYPNLEDFPDTEIRIRYDTNNNDNESFTADDCPRHFLWLSDKAVKEELDYKVKKGKWSERVMVEKTYFTLFYGGTGLASQYMDSVDDFQTDLEGWDVMNRNSNHCDWEGIECLEIKTQNSSESNKAPNFVVGFSINGFSLEGTLPDDLHHLSHLRKLDLNGNRIQGTIPASWGKLKHLVELDLSFNRLSGSIPSTLEAWTNLRFLELNNNQLEGEISPKLIEAWTRKREDNIIRNKNLAHYDESEFEVLDLGGNNFRGRFPMDTLMNRANYLRDLDLSGNSFTGDFNFKVEQDTEESCQSYDPQNCTEPISKSPKLLKYLKGVDLSKNSFQGQLSNEWMKLSSLRTLDLSRNELTGSLPEEIWRASSLQKLDLSYNQLTGTIHSYIWNQDEDEPDGSWSELIDLEILYLDHNQISGTIPEDLFHGLGESLEEINLGKNQLTGSLPSSLSKMRFLTSLDVHGNQLTGKLPHEMNQMSPNLQLNLTDNKLVGSVPKLFCGGGAASTNLLFRQFGCDAILCPAGTFHPNGAASLYSGCRPCPIQTGDDPSSTRILGRINCGNDNDNDNSTRTRFVHGDLNGDGELSEREVLRLLYTYTGGQNWGTQFENWADTSVDKCDLNGVGCIDGRLVKLDLTDATFCATADRKAAQCKGIPSELSKLTDLEIFIINRRNFLRGTLPTEIGELSNLKYFDISSCPMMTGTLPTEMGQLTNLIYLNVGGCRFNGTIPDELFQLEKLEKLHLSMNRFTGTIPSSMEKMKSLKELLLSRTFVNGSIPEGFGELGALENLEMYGNQLVGPIPESIGGCTSLKRLDLFNNKLSGTIPESLADIRALQILHIKSNHLSGTISSKFGKLPNLSWFDVSTNHLHGTIPESFGYSKTLKDFRLGGGNMIHNPVPKSLCTNTNINGGLTKTYGCSGVICPLGTYSDPGHATHSDGCKPCPNGRTTIYLGSSRCVELSEEDILTMFYDVMGNAGNPNIGNGYDVVQEQHWNFDRDAPICSWNGVRCDQDGVVESIWFPLLGLDIG